MKAVEVEKELIILYKILTEANRNGGLTLELASLGHSTISKLQEHVKLLKEGEEAESKEDDKKFRRTPKKV